MSDVVSINSTAPKVEDDVNARTKAVCRGLRRLADKIENDAFGPIEYGLVALSLGLPGPPVFIGLADMRRDSAVGLLTMAAQNIITGNDLERT